MRYKTLARELDCLLHWWDRDMEKIGEPPANTLQIDAFISGWVAKLSAENDMVTIKDVKKVTDMLPSMPFFIRKGLTGVSKESFTRHETTNS